MNLKSLGDNINSFVSKKQNLLFLTGIFLVAAFWRFYNIGVFPRGLNASEYNLVNDLISLSKNHWLINPSQIQHAAYYYTMGLFGYFVNFNALYMRLFQAGIGLLLTVIFYLFVKDWFNRQTAFLATLLFSTSSFIVLVSRGLQPEILSPFIILTGLYVFTVAMKKKNYYLFALGGALSGVLLYVGEIYILLPILAIILYLYAKYKYEQTFKEYWRGFLIAGIAFTVAAIPYIYFLPQNISPIIGALNPGSIGRYYLNLGGNVQALVYQSAVDKLYNVGAEPLLDPFIAISFICGLAYAVFYLKRRKFLILVAWFVAAIAAISLKGVQTLTDFIVLMPVVYTLSAIMLDYILTHWIRTFPYNKPARIMMTLFFSLFLFLSVFYNYQKYFWAWGKNQGIQDMYKYNVEYEVK